MQSDKAPATRVVGQGHGRLSWVGYRRRLIEFGDMFSRKLTLARFISEKTYGQLPTRSNYKKTPHSGGASYEIQVNG